MTLYSNSWGELQLACILPYSLHIRNRSVQVWAKNLSTYGDLPWFKLNTNSCIWWTYSINHSSCGICHQHWRCSDIHTSFPTVCFLENAVKLLLEPELFRGDRAHGPETRAWTRGLDRESGSLPLQHCSNLPSRVTTKDLRLEINKPIFLCYRWPTAHRTHRKQILSSSEIVLEHCLRC